jgi:hypothetical protein
MFQTTNPTITQDASAVASHTAGLGQTPFGPAVIWGWAAPGGPYCCPEKLRPSSSPNSSQRSGFICCFSPPPLSCSKILPIRVASKAWPISNRPVPSRRHLQHLCRFFRHQPAEETRFKRRAPFRSGIRCGRSVQCAVQCEDAPAYFASDRQLPVEHLGQKRARG